jgi:hypothetical protein
MDLIAYLPAACYLIAGFIFLFYGLTDDRVVFIWRKIRKKGQYKNSRFKIQDSDCKNPFSFNNFWRFILTTFNNLVNYLF